MLASRGPRKQDGRELMSRQRVQTRLPTARGWAGRCVSLPCLLLREVFPNKAPLEPGSSFLLDGDRTLCIGGDCCTSLQTLPVINRNEGLEEDTRAHTNTSKVVARKANCSNCLAARNLAKVCLMPEPFANSSPGSHTPVASALGWAQF